MRVLATSLVLLALCPGLAALSGFGVSGPVSLDMVAPSLGIIAPNGGESWAGGSTEAILWSAADNHFGTGSIDIWYSLDGVNFISLAGGSVNDGHEVWTLPNVQSNSARVKLKATDQFGNYTQRISAQAFEISDPLPMPPGGVNMTIVNNSDVLLTWLPVTQNVDGSPFTPDGYMVLYSEDPEGGLDGFYFLGDTSGLSYVHQRVAHFRDNMFYLVVAYSEPRGLEALLGDAFGPELRGVSYSRIKALLQGREREE